MTRFRIRELREARGLSQHGLARRLGVTKMAVSRWESGAAMPTADKLPTIAALLECEVNDLYDAIPEPQANATHVTIVE